MQYNSMVGYLPCHKVTIAPIILFGIIPVANVCNKIQVHTLWMHNKCQYMWLGLQQSTTYCTKIAKFFLIITSLFLQSYNLYHKSRRILLKLQNDNTPFGTKHIHECNLHSRDWFSQAPHIHKYIHTYSVYIYTHTHYVNTEIPLLWLSLLSTTLTSVIVALA